MIMQFSGTIILLADEEEEGDDDCSAPLCTNFIICVSFILPISFIPSMTIADMRGSFEKM